MNQKEPLEDEILLGIDEAARRLGVSPWTIRGWLKIGYIGSNKLGSRRLIPQSEVTRLIKLSSKAPTREILVV